MFVGVYSNKVTILHLQRRIGKKNHQSGGVYFFSLTYTKALAAHFWFLSKFTQ